jgi:hypothetical protein
MGVAKLALQNPPPEMTCVPAGQSATAVKFETTPVACDETHWYVGPPLFQTPDSQGDQPKHVTQKSTSALVFPNIDPI